MEELLPSRLHHFVYSATGHISSHVETHKHGKHPTGFKTPKHMDVPEDWSVRISAAGNDNETHTDTHTHKGLPADHEPFVTSTPVRMFTIPYRGLRDPISSRGSRKKYGPEEGEREGEREKGHLEMPGEVLLRSMPRR